MLPFRARVDLGAMVMKRCSTVPKKPQHHRKLTISLFSITTRPLVGVGVLTPLQRCSWCILQPQPTELSKRRVQQNKKTKLCSRKKSINRIKPGWLVGCLLCFFGLSTLFGSFNTQLSHFDKSFKQFILV